MPKKHTPSYTTTKPTYVHPSLQSSRAPATASSPAGTQTVNQRIQQLRREQAPRATPEVRDELTAAVSNRTVPPELRRILHIPEVNAPKPKANARTRRVVGGTRPPPGPAAPNSWLQTSRRAPAYMRKKKAEADSRGAARFATLARVSNEDRKVRISPHISRVADSPGLMLYFRLLTHNSAYHHLKASSTIAYEPLPSIGKNSRNMSNITSGGCRYRSKKPY